MAGKGQRVRDKTQEGSATAVATRLSTDAPVNGKVEELIGRTGARGEITQIKCLVLAGRNEGRSMRRNVKGPVKIGDLITLRETEIEARRIKGSVKGARPSGSGERGRRAF